MDKYIDILNISLSANNVCKSHGINHAIYVINNAKKH
jgi:hypothetical protein